MYARAWSSTEVTADFNSGAGGGYIDPTSILVRADMNENTGTTAYDSSQMVSWMWGYKYYYTDTEGQPVNDFFLYSFMSGGNFKIAFYNDTGAGAPDKLLWSCASTASAATTWNDVAEASGTRANSWDGTLAHNKWYWLMWKWSNGNMGPGWGTGTTNYGISIVHQYATAFPSTWSGGTVGSVAWSEYLDYAPTTITTTETETTTHTITTTTTANTTITIPVTVTSTQTVNTTITHTNTVTLTNTTTTTLTIPVTVTTTNTTTSTKTSTVTQTIPTTTTKTTTKTNTATSWTTATANTTTTKTTTSWIPETTTTTMSAYNATVTSEVITEGTGLFSISSGILITIILMILFIVVIAFVLRKRGQSM